MWRLITTTVLYFTRVCAQYDDPNIVAKYIIPITKPEYPKYPGYENGGYPRVYEDPYIPPNALQENVGSRPFYSPDNGINSSPNQNFFGVTNRSDKNLKGVNGPPNKNSLGENYPVAPTPYFNLLTLPVHENEGNRPYYSPPNKNSLWENYPVAPTPYYKRLLTLPVHENEGNRPYYSPSNQNDNGINSRPYQKNSKGVNGQQTYNGIYQDPSQKTNFYTRFSQRPASPGAPGYLRDAKRGSSKSQFNGLDAFLLDLDYGPSIGPNVGINPDGPDPFVEPKTELDSESYYEDLELVDNFGLYLLHRTQFDPSVSNSLNDAAHQYNALLAVLVALARVIRHSCDDFEEVYDKLYFPTVDAYYKYGLANADRVSTMIEDYIRRGNAHLPKMKRLKDEICEKERFCSVAFDNRIKASPLMYVKELETLEALAHLARSYYPYIDEFTLASQKGTVLTYLQRSKDRLKEYIMHVINTIEHITDTPIRCTS